MAGQRIRLLIIQIVHIKSAFSDSHGHIEYYKASPIQFPDNLARSISFVTPK